MADYIVKSKLTMVNKGNKIFPVDYVYGPWASLDAAWTALTGSSTGTTKMVQQGNIIAYKDATDGNRVKELQLVDPMPEDGYTKDYLVAKPTPGAVEKGTTVTTTNDGEIGGGVYNKTTEETGTGTGTTMTIGCGPDEGEEENTIETHTDGTTYIRGVGTYDGTNAEAGVNDIATVIDGIETAAGSVTKTAKGGYKMPDATDAEKYAFAEGKSTTAGGLASHAEGLGTKTTNTGEHAEGTYNVTGADVLSSIGNGGADDDRSNVVEVHTDGTVYVYGIGTYDGTNATADTNDIVTVLEDKEDIYEKITLSTSTLPTTIKRNTIIEFTSVPASITLADTTVTEGKELVVLFNTVGVTTLPTITIGSDNRYVGDIPTIEAEKYYVIVLFKNTVVMAERKA